MQPGDVVDDRFELAELAGSGGMGAVYRARDRSTGEPVALKVMRSIAAEHDDRFAREIRVLAQLRHPGIVRYIADGTSQGEMWLAMEWLEGESLAQRVRRTGITTTDAISVVRRIAEAVGAAHERGVIHRDLKPSNIFVVHDDLARVKLLDFGVARIGASDLQSTRTGVMIGTPGYMAPEQARGDREVGPRADVFALGCVLYELLTGSHAFVGDNVMAVLAKILLEDAPRISELRPELAHDLDDLIARVLAKHADERPADGSALALALGNLDEVEPIRTSMVEVRRSLTTSERRLLCVVLIGGATDGFDTFVDSVANDATLAPSVQPSLLTTPGSSLVTQVYSSLRTTAAAHGAGLERLIDGSHVVTLHGSGTAGDQAMQAARCALALKQVAPGAPMALATGRGVFAGRWPVGEAIDRAATLLAAAERAPQSVRIDDVTAGLLDARFELGGDEAGLTLVAERDVTETARTLLGKVTPCVGRDRELGVLAGLYDECVAEPIARAVVATGAAGIGKSRVRVELLRRIQALGPAEVWIGRGEPLRVGSPYGMLAPALRRTAGIRDGETLELRRQKLRARVCRNAAVPFDPVFLAELIGAPSDDAPPELHAARQDPQLMAEQIRRAFVQWVALESSAQPLVIVLEDLHWGDLPSVKLIDAVLRELADRPVFVLALARPEVNELFPKLWAERGAQELRLDELTKKGCEKLVRGALGAAADDTLVVRLVEQAAGNAFYLEELIRASAEGKGDVLPETVLAVVQSRLERLELDARRVLRAASVFGARFWRGGVMALLGDEVQRTREWLDELCERELVARVSTSRFPHEDELQFRHALVREAANAMLTDADRKLGHRLAGEWLEHAGEGDPMVLADHFERGGDPARARNYYRAAAEQALAACDFASALARAARVVGESGEIELIRAEALRWTGEFADAAAHARTAMTLLPIGSRAWFAAANEAAEAAGKIGDAVQVDHVAAALRGAPVEPAMLGARVTALANTAFVLFSFGNHGLAITLLDLVEQAAPEVQDPATLARIYQARSSRAMVTGDAGAYLESERAACEAFERAGDLRYACVQRGHLGYAYQELGAYAEAEEALRDALARGTDLNLLNVVATAKHNLGRVLQLRGALDEAAVVESEAIALFEAQGDRRLSSASRCYLAMILYARGEFEDAEHEVKLAIETSQLPMQAPYRATLARIRIASGRMRDALADARTAMAILASLGAIEEGEALVRLVLAETLLGNNARAEARTVILEARTRLMARAVRITDEVYRKSFLERVPDHARTIELANRLS